MTAATAGCRAALAGGLLLWAAANAAAQDVTLPRITAADVRWDTVRAALAARPWVFPSTEPHEETPDPIDLINQISSRVFPSIASSPVPVLLPLDAKTLLEQETPEPADSLGRFGKPKFFLAGPAGYSAVYAVSLPAQGLRTKAREAEIHISGFAFLYQLPARVGGEQKPLNGTLLAEFSGLRRIFFEGDMRYLFERHGVLYEVAVECFEGRHSRRPPCTDAHELIVPFLNALQIAGGLPQSIPLPPLDTLTLRPQQRSQEFSYLPPGALVSGSSRRGGEDDHTVYAPIRFPLADGPVQSYSQLFMDLGDCTAEPGDSRPVRRNGVRFRCKPAKTLAPEEMPRGGQNNYPWRDSFCERRAHYVGQCPAGTGHQGQDLVPIGCAFSERDQPDCARTRRRIVAVHDGVVLRRPAQEGLIVVANAPGTHLRFRYLHMHPKAVDADGWFSGRVVREGEVLGRVSNFSGRAGGTSYHLHVDMQVPSKDGWTLVNPYMTLVTAYEKMIGGRGIEIQPSSPLTAAGVIDAAVPPEYASPAKQPRKKRGARSKHKRTK